MVGLDRQRPGVEGPLMRHSQWSPWRAVEQGHAESMGPVPQLPMMMAPVLAQEKKQKQTLASRPWYSTLELMMLWAGARQPQDAVVDCLVQMEHVQCLTQRFAMSKMREPLSVPAVSGERLLPLHPLLAWLVTCPERSCHPHEDLPQHQRSTPMVKDLKLLRSGKLQEWCSRELAGWCWLVTNPQLQWWETQ